MPEPHKGFPSNRRVAYVALALAICGSGSMAYYHLGLFIPRMLAVRAFYGGGNGYSFGGDFYPIWLTTRQWRTNRLDLYSQAMTRQIQTGLFGRPLDPRFPNDPPVEYREFAYPAFADLLLWPSALLPFPTFRLMLAVVLPLLTIASLRFWLLAFRWDVGKVWFAILSLLALSTYEVLEALFAEQPGLIVGLALAAAVFALTSNRFLLAGILMSLTLIKPQMTVLAIAYLLLWGFSERRRLPFAIGFGAMTGTLLLASWWIWPNWILEWLHILFGYHRYAMPPLIAVLFGSTHLVRVITAGLLGFNAFVAWRNRRAPADSIGFWTTLSLTLAVTSVTILPGQAVYDHIILIPGILVLWRHWREIRAASSLAGAVLLVCTATLFWPWFAAFVLIVSRPLAPSVCSSYAIFTTPIRTAASLPFLVLALLMYALRVLSPVREPA